MGERVFASGSEAVGMGAIDAGCEAYFGYPLTPQNEIIEWVAREFPRRGKVFVQAPSETGVINMVYGAACTGVRVMTSTSSPGWCLMMETFSDAIYAQLPFVVNQVARGGPGEGTTRHSQMDYITATCGGGNGGCRNIALAPFSVQETYDFEQLAFYIADKYRSPVVILSEAIINQTREPLERHVLDFGPLPEKDWAVRGKAFHKDGRKRLISASQGMLRQPPYPTYMSLIAEIDKKLKAMAESEVRYETYSVDDAELILVAYGYVARVCLEALRIARSRGVKVGLIRPVSIWPFPYHPIREKALQGCKFLVVEDSLGQLVQDVKMGVAERAEVHLLSMLARHDPYEIGMIFPGSVLQEIEKLMR